METNTPQNQPPNLAGISDETIVFDTGSGISLEEQQEILSGINAMTIGNRLSTGATAVKAKKRGFLFPLFVNIGAIIILAAGFFLLSVMHIHNEQEIRNNSVDIGLTERLLIREIRDEANPAITELSRLSDERAKAAGTESLMGGYFEKLKNEIKDGRLNEASVTLTEAKKFLNTPLFRSFPNLETGRQSYLSAIDSMEKVVSEAIKLREEMAAEGREVLSETLEELNTRYASLEAEKSSLSARKDADIEEKEAQLKRIETARNADIAEKEVQIRRLETADKNRQETLKQRETEIANLRKEREERDRRISELNAGIAREIAQKEDLQRKLNDLQGWIDTVIRSYPGASDPPNQ